MRSCEGFVDYNQNQSRYSMLKISLRIGSIALSALARADLIRTNFEPIIKSSMFLRVEHYWKILQNG